MSKQLFEMEQQSTERIEQEAELSPEDKRAKFIHDHIIDLKEGRASLSYSSLSRFKKSPKSYIDYKLEPYEQTDAQQLGSLVHSLLFEPAKFNEKYVTDTEICAQIGGAKPRGTNDYRAWKLKQTGKTIVSQEDVDLAKRMAKAVQNNPASARQLNKCKTFERKINFTHKGFKFVSFLDADGEVVCDLKICTDADPKKFQREIINNGYWFQTGVYMVAKEEQVPYFIIAVDRGCNVSVHEIDENFVEYAMQEFDRLVDDFKDCLEKNRFHQSYEYRANTPEGAFIMTRPPYL